MFTTRRWITGVLALTIATGACFCEDTEPGKFYKLEFVVREVQGAKVLNARTYSSVVAAGRSSEIRAGTKIPYVSKQGGTTEFQQIDIGVNIDAKDIKEVQSHLNFTIFVEISSIAEVAPDPTDHPVVRQNRWTSNATVPFKKPTLLFSSDSTDAKTQMQVEVTATPLPGS
jgi:hypothetical protein